MKYDLIGLYPPPWGGRSVYSYRYAKVLRERGLDVEEVDYTSLPRSARLWYLLKCIWRPGNTAFHLNYFHPWLMLALIMRPFPKKIIYTDHCNPGFANHSRLQSAIFHRFLGQCAEVILVGEHLKRSYAERGYRLPPSVRVQDAYIPPPLEDEPRIWASYADATIAFVEAHRPLVIANGARIQFHEGQDRYGIDMCIDLIAALTADYPRIGLLFALPEIGDQAYFERLNQHIAGLVLTGAIHFLTGQKELWALFRRAQVMVRPATLDGYSLSVAEALHFGCPAVVSDVCARPAGSVLFRNRDLGDLVAKVRGVLEQGNHDPSRH